MIYDFLSEVIDVKNAPGQTPEFFGGSAAQANSLLKYVQAMDPETIAQLSKPMSSDLLQVMESNIMGLLGGLPSQHFDITVATSREDLGRLLASAMMSGYFLRGAEQRMALEHTLEIPETPFETE